MIAMSRRKAIVIGIDQYENMDPLYGCRTDAEEVAQCLTLSPDDFDVELIVNTAATRANILTAIGEKVYLEGNENPETLLIYFAGHGVIKGTSGYIVTHDATEFDPGVPLNQIADLMETASTHYERVVLLLDCCHAGAAQLGRGAIPITGDAINNEIPTRNSSKCILGACTTESFAYETESLSSKGMFTNVLVGGLLGDAVDHKGRVTALSLYEWINDAMDHVKQTPVFKGDISGTLVLRTGLEPRKGAPILSEKLAEVLAKGQQLMDGYESSVNAHLAQSITRRDGGARRCANELEGIIDWFDETQKNLGDLVRDAVWKSLNADLLNARKRLADVMYGEFTYAGQLSEKIGEGGFGQVWKTVCEDGKTDALKIYHGAELSQPQKRERFRNGFYNMRKLDHPHIVKVKEFRQAPLSFTMDYIEGEDLGRFYLDPNLNANIPAAKLKLLIDISETLIHAHAHNVLHRDIKPGNIIIRQEGDVPVPYLTDFDLAYHETNRTLSEIGGVGGVANYAAPEQFYEPNKKTARQVTVDIFSFAQIMFYLITGHNPSGDSIESNISELEKALRDWSPSSAGQNILKLYEKSSKRIPAHRPQSMMEVHGILGDCWSRVARVDERNTLTVDEMLSDCGYAYGGAFGYKLEDGELTFRSKSGRLHVTISSMGSHGPNTADFRLRLEDVGGFVFQGASTQVARNALHKRVDRVMKQFELHHRENIKSGNFGFIIPLEGVLTTSAGTGRLSTLVVALVAEIEQ